MYSFYENWSNLKWKLKQEETSYKNLSSDERESKKVLDSGFHTVDSGFKVLDSGFFVTGTWIPDSNL